jgi:hypothetical protein
MPPELSPRGGHLGHLIRRFVGSLSRRAVPASDERWALSSLLDAERQLWLRCSIADQRHTIAVARRACELSPKLAQPGERPVLAACLLHDIGKLDAGLGTFGRVLATVWGAARGERAERGSGRIARYLRHEPIGATMLAAAGSDELTVWLVGGDPRAPRQMAELLRQADDG